jgi:hypothetical protein
VEKGEGFFAVAVLRKLQKRLRKNSHSALQRLKA